MSGHRIRVRNNPYNMARTAEDRREYRRRWRELDARNLACDFALTGDLHRYTRDWMNAGNHASFPGFDEWKATQP